MPRSASGTVSEVSTTSQSVDDDDDDERHRDKRRVESVSKKGDKRQSGGVGKDEKGERKLITPPPIIGPNGKELPRPKDPEGRPLPIYVDEEKKPVLDSEGNPIAVRFQKDGKPIPYEKYLELKAKGGGGKSRIAVVEADDGGSSPAKVPRYCLWVGLTDFVISLIFVAYYAWLTSSEASGGGGRIPQYATTVAFFVAALLAAILPYVAVSKNKQTFLWIWCAVAIVLMIGQIIASATIGGEPFVKNYLFIAVLYCFFRIALVGGTMCCIGLSEDYSSGGNTRYVMASGGGYPRGGGGRGNQTVIVQQPGYGYGYPYGGYYGGYYGGASYGDAALLGFAAGSMMGGGWGYGGYGGWGYGGGLGLYDGGFGCYDDCYF